MDLYSFEMVEPKTNTETFDPLQNWTKKTKKKQATTLATWQCIAVSFCTCQTCFNLIRVNVFVATFANVFIVQ